MKTKITKQANPTGDVLTTPAGLVQQQRDRGKLMVQAALSSLLLGAGYTALTRTPKTVGPTPLEVEEPTDNYLVVGNVKPKKVPALSKESGLVSMAGNAVGSALSRAYEAAKPAISDAATSVGNTLSSARDSLSEALIPQEQYASGFRGVAGPTLAALSIGGGLAAGGYGMSKLLDHIEGDTRAQELEAAEEAFQKARAKQYAEMLREKAGSVIDQLFEKVSNDKAHLPSGAMKVLDNTGGAVYGPTLSWLSNGALGKTPISAWRTALGVALLGGAGAGAIGFAGGYRSESPDSKKQLAAKILRQRAAERTSKPYAAIPQFYATTEPLALDDTQ